VVLALIIVSWFYLRPYKINFPKPVFLLVFIWLVIFLFLLKSLLGIIAFLGTLVIGLILMIGSMKKRSWQIGFFVALMAVIFIPVYLTAKVVADYFDFKDVDSESIEYKTVSGNDYLHNFEEKSRENGYLIYLYICDEELRNEWNKRSELKYDDLLNGYPLSSTLIRYITSKGLRKDSTGICSLSEEDIRLIESGVTNYKFADHRISIFPRIYETVWELDNYFRTGDPNFKSVAQRMEYLKASLYIIREHPLFGIGTGNWQQKYDESYHSMGSRLLKENRAPSHNQYTNYLVKFGFTGTSLIVFFLLFPVFFLKHGKNYIFILFLFAIAFANLGDSNLETHMGLSFFTFFYSIFLLNSTDEMKKSLL
jgi:4-amino-4-deoxy-L-arabinose transferase-like glycosyltransferase